MKPSRLFSIGAMNTLEPLATTAGAAALSIPLISVKANKTQQVTTLILIRTSLSPSRHFSVGVINPTVNWFYGIIGPKIQMHAPSVRFSPMRIANGTNGGYSTQYGTGRLLRALFKLTESRHYVDLGSRCP